MRLPNSVGFADADLALHVAVAHASGNLFMRSIGAVIEAALRASFLLSAPVEPEDRDTVLLWHQKIVDGIAAGDAQTASEAMVYVIHNGMRRHEARGAAVRGYWRKSVTELRIAIVGFGKIARDQHVGAIAATAGATLAAVASRNASLPGVPHFRDHRGTAGKGTADRRRLALHAAAGAARPGRRRRSLPAST